MSCNTTGNRIPSFATRRLLTAMALAAGLVVGAGCGNKKPPLPPPQVIPARTIDLQVQQRGGELLLSFTFPTTTLAGLPLGDPSGVEFWELVREVPLYPTVSIPSGKAEEGTAVPAPDGDEDVSMAAKTPAAGDGQEEADAPGPPAGWEPPDRLEDLAVVDALEFQAAATIRLILTGPELASAILGDKITVRFPLGDAPASDEVQAHTFAVKTLSATGTGSPFSNLATIVRRDPPAAPTDFKVTPGPEGIELGWTFAGEGPEEEHEAPEAEERIETVDLIAAEREASETETTESEIEFDGFHVYRRDARERNYGSPQGRVDKSRRTYLDRSARLGEAYIYAVAAIVESAPLVESTLSTEREVDYDDRFAPPAPRNLVTLVESNSVRLLWDASTANDVDGYFVLRQSGGEGEYVQLNQKPIRELEYTDAQIVSGRAYRYRVVAIDQVGNRGEGSAPSEVRIP